MRSGMATASNNVKNIRKLIKKQRSGAALQSRLRRQRADQQTAETMVMAAEVLGEDDYEACWKAACAEMVEQEAFRSSSKVREKDVKKINTSKIVTGKARLEYQWSQLGEDWKKAFEEALVKAVKIYFDHDALEGVLRDKVIDPKEILSSRFILTNKGGSNLAEAELKARLILGGHMDPDMGKYPTLAPTAALLAHNLINWIAVQCGWEVKYEDVSSAFLQGRPLPAEREVYVRIPKGYPDCVGNYIRIKLGPEYRQDLMRMTKGGFGLPESPRLWYLSYKDTLEESEMKELDLLPGVFAAYHEDGSLRSMHSRG